MREQIQARLEVLKGELEKGQTELEKVERQRTYLRETLLQIGGAIQVLEELLGEGEVAGQQDSTSTNETQPSSVKTS
jgi:predicted nuclease with TOPRIM domain